MSSLLSLGPHVPIQDFFQGGGGGGGGVQALWLENSLDNIFF